MSLRLFAFISLKPRRTNQRLKNVADRSAEQVGPRRASGSPNSLFPSAGGHKRNSLLTEDADMRPTSALLFPLLLLLLPLRCHGRTVSRCELRDKLRDKIKLSERTQNLTDVVLTMLVCHLEKVSHRSTGFVTIYGQRATTTAAPATTTTTTTIPATNSTTAANQIVNSNATVPTPLSNSTSAAPVNQSAIGNQTVNSNQTEVNDGQDQDQEDDATGEEPEQEEEPEEEEPLPEVEEEEELVDGASEETYDEESEYLYANQGSKMDFHLDDWLKLMELLNEEENMFDEQMLVIADNKLSADDEDDSGGMVFQMEWSLGYHGLFQLSDSYFCQSTARWSQNACNSTCDAFTDDDIADDLDCFVDSLYWLYTLRTVAPRCYQTADFFGQCN